MLLPEPLLGMQYLHLKLHLSVTETLRSRGAGPWCQLPRAFDSASGELVCLKENRLKNEGSLPDIDAGDYGQGKRDAGQVRRAGR